MTCSFASSAIWKFIATKSASTLVMGYNLGDGCYVNLYTSASYGITIDIKAYFGEGIFRVCLQNKPGVFTDAIADRVYNMFIFLAALNNRETYEFIDILARAFKSTLVHDISTELFEVFNRQVLPGTNMIMKFDKTMKFDFSGDDDIQSKVLSELHKVRFEDCRGLLVGILNKNTHAALELSYFLGGDRINALSLIIGHEHCQLNLVYNGVYYGFYPESLCVVKYSMFYDMFVKLSRSNVEAFLDELLYLFFVPTESLEVLAEAALKVKYDTELCVTQKHMFYDIEDEEYFWLPSYYTPADMAFYDIGAPLKKVRKEYLCGQATMIAAAFKGWKARMMYTFNPGTTLGRYYVMRDVGLCSRDIASGDGGVGKGCAEVLKGMFF